jgi:hypothetical protein
MMTSRSLVIAFLLAAATTLPAAAQNSGKTPERPLEFDPAKPEPVDGWWTNGTELMRLDANGAYRLWVSQDRFKRPVELGAWRRSNYVFFDLEPYRAKAGTRFRVNLQKEDGVTELRRDGMKDFRKVGSAPHIPADDMLGAWVAASESLLVLENGRYEWQRTAPSQGITQHSGIWNTDGDVLTLAPDSPAIDPISVRCVRDANGQFVLEGRGGRMTHPPTDPAKAEPAPAAPADTPPAKPSSPDTKAPPADATKQAATGATPPPTMCAHGTAQPATTDHG